MKTLLPVLGLVLLTFVSASAQVSVEVTMDQEQFLPSESVRVAVRITNRSGQSLHLGADAGWLTFSVEAADGFIVIKNTEVPVLGEFDVGSSEVATKRVDLSPYFVLTHPGRYRVIATLRIADWKMEMSSEPKKFDIISGAKLWSQDFGVPASAGVPNGAPEVRKYTLIEANYLQTQLRLYVQVSDESESRVYKAMAVGKMLSFSTPEAQLDRFSNLHVLWQDGASTYSYVVVNPSGVLARREVYDYKQARPRLGINDASDITVIGGVRRVNPEETPVIKPSNDSPPPATTKP